MHFRYDKTTIQGNTYQRSMMAHELPEDMKVVSIKRHLDHRVSITSATEKRPRTERITIPPRKVEEAINKVKENDKWAIEYLDIPDEGKRIVEAIQKGKVKAIFLSSSLHFSCRPPLACLRVQSLFSYHRC